jgi:tetratricopeptide (TPR) repeat protein
MEKVIIKGYLEFGSPSTYQKVLNLYLHKAEVLYKWDLFFKDDSLFQEDKYSIKVPHFIGVGNEKTWRNTRSILELFAEFAIAGRMGFWIVQEGTLKEYNSIEPKGEKVAIQEYIKGKNLLKTNDSEAAKECLDKAIEKYENHALAYERRGKVNIRLGNLKEAMYDLSKSILINPFNPEPYLNRAKLHFHKEDYQSTFEDLDQVIKNSIGLQPIYWKARRFRADLFIRMKDYHAAIKEFDLIKNKKFAPNDPNFDWRQSLFFIQFGTALLEVGRHKDALELFNTACEIEQNLAFSEPGETYFLRSVALKQLGKNHIPDLEKAAKLGSTKAKELISVPN